MDKRQSLNVGGIICLIAAVYITCCLLRQGNAEPFSIYSVWSCISHWPKHLRVVAVGLLPVYVALMIFGTAIFAKYLGSVIQRWITYFLHQK